MKKSKFDFKKFGLRTSNLIILSLICILVGFVLIVATYGFNELDYSGDVYTRTAALLSKESDYKKVTTHDNSALDNFTDSLMILTAMHPNTSGDSLVASAMKNSHTQLSGSPRKAFEGDITAETFEQAAPAEEEKVVSEPIVDTEGFMPEAADMNGVSESFSEPEQSEEENVMDLEKKELTEEDISNEIYGFIQAQAKEQEKDPLVDMDSMVKSEEEKEEVVIPDGEEIVVPETVAWEPTAVEEEKEENVREVPEIAPEREEAIVPIMEMEDSVEKEEIEEEKEDLSFDYSDVTEKDIESTNSIAILEEMRKAKEKKLKEKREAEEKAAKEEKALVVSREEASKLRKRAEEAEKAVQAKMQEFQKYIDSYDEEIEEANKRREKAASDKAETDEEIAKYQASISSNTDIEKELESMMTADAEEEKSTKKGK